MRKAKTRAVAQQEQTKQRFFLLIAVPTLIGFLIGFVSLANASRMEQNQKDVAHPVEQGWQVYDGPKISF